jgi:hypothetical protein
LKGFDIGKISVRNDKEKEFMNFAREFPVKILAGLL